MSYPNETFRTLLNLIKQLILSRSKLAIYGTFRSMELPAQWNLQLATGEHENEQTLKIRRKSTTRRKILIFAQSKERQKKHILLILGL